MSRGRRADADLGARLDADGAGAARPRPRFARLAGACRPWTAPLAVADGHADGRSAGSTSLGARGIPSRGRDAAAGDRSRAEPVRPPPGPAGRANGPSPATLGRTRRRGPGRRRHRRRRGRRPAHPRRPPTARPAPGHPGPSAETGPAERPASPRRSRRTSARRLREVAGPASRVMRVHDGPRADAHRPGRRADAVTLGGDVYVRQGRLAPARTGAAAALLAHEASPCRRAARPGRPARAPAGRRRRARRRRRSRWCRERAVPPAARGAVPVPRGSRAVRPARGTAAGRAAAVPRPHRPRHARRGRPRAPSGLDGSRTRRRPRRRCAGPGRRADAAAADRVRAGRLTMTATASGRAAASPSATGSRAGQGD